MRRAFLLAGIAAGSIALFTTVTVAANQRARSEPVAAFKEKLADLTFCRTGYDIASSKPHYASKFVSGTQKLILLDQSDRLASKKDQLDELIVQHISEAEDLDLSPKAIQDIVVEVQWQAELDAVQLASWVEEPNEFLDRLDQRCEVYVS